MLGGKNKDDWKCKNPQLAYYINDIGWIEFINICNPNKNILRYTLEEFLEKFPYKVGDKVLYYENPVFITQMEWIEDSVSYHFYYKGRELMLPVNHLQPYKEETMEEKGDKAKAPNLIGEDYYGKRFGYKIPNGYEFDCIKNNEIILKPKQPQYPKTYEECCEVLGYKLVGETVIGYDAKLITSFQRLKVCRDAYWKIAGEEMGLDKPWEPDWNHDTEKYVIYPYQYLYSIDKENYRNTILAFPTREMRDAFYENFKDLIEDCKNLI